MLIEIVNSGEVIDVYNRHGEYKGRGIVVRHQDADYTHIIRMTTVADGVYPYDYEVGGEYGYQAPSLSRHAHLRGGLRCMVAVADAPADPINPF